jgi:hypothetical protein
MYIDLTLDDKVDEKDPLRTKQPSRTKEPLAPRTTPPNAVLIQAENALLDIGRRDQRFWYLSFLTTARHGSRLYSCQEARVQV